MQERKEKTFEKQLVKEKTQAERSLAKLKRREFACEEDARKEAELWVSEHPFCIFKDISNMLNRLWRTRSA
jgi:transposase